MANILLLDDDPVARKALAGILGRAEHKYAAVATTDDAFRFILQNVEVDLFITEMKLGNNGGNPLNLLRLIRGNRFLKTMPVLVYTTVTGRDNVKSALAMRVQNYLLKPYSDAKVFTEVKRAQEWGWINGHFDEPASFCRQMGLSMDAWHALVEELRDCLLDLIPALKISLREQQPALCEEKLNHVTRLSEECGFWTLYDVLNEIASLALKSQWIRVNAAVANLPIADKFIRHMLEPDNAPAGFVDADQYGLEHVELPADSWLREEVLAKRPLASREETLQKLETLATFPVIEGMAAEFRMAADGHGTSLQSASDIVANDPGLTALLLQAVNNISNNPDSLIEDSRQAAQMLGAHRLQEAAETVVTIPETCFSLPPDLSWNRFWMYQYGCAQVCNFMCDFMEIPIFLPHAYWVGMLHGMGKTALAALYPESFPAAARLAVMQACSMSKAYEALVGCTPEEAGASLAERLGFPAEFVNVMRHVADPENAVEDAELTAIVSFCSAICRRYDIGASGEPPLPTDLPMEEFPGWSIIRERVFPSFDMARFSDVMKDWSNDLRLSLSGRASYVTD